MVVSRMGALTALAAAVVICLGASACDDSPQTQSDADDARTRDADVSVEDGADVSEDIPEDAALDEAEDSAPPDGSQPDAEFDGKDCYVIRFTFDWEKRPEWTRKKPPFKKYQIPSQIEKLIWDGMLETEEQKFSQLLNWD